MVQVRPKQVGGSLIRQCISFLRENGCSLPFDSHILIAISGGSDSVGLAHLLSHYGRRIVPKKLISLLHINQKWRDVESDRDEAFVRQLGQEWGLPVIIDRTSLSPQASYPKRCSWEAEARRRRKEIFLKEACQRNAVVMTAHQADDLAETVLWRILTGVLKTQGGGILFRHGVEMRPFLKFRKNRIRSYLEEEGISYREDRTNFSTRFLRSRMRHLLIPEMESLFPKAVDNLNQIAWDFQQKKHENC